MALYYLSSRSDKNGSSFSLWRLGASREELAYSCSFEIRSGGHGFSRWGKARAKELLSTMDGEEESEKGIPGFRKEVYVNEEVALSMLNQARLAVVVQRHNIRTTIDRPIRSSSC